MVVQKMQDFYEFFGVSEYDLYTADMLGIIPTPGIMCSEQSKQEIDEILLGMQGLDGLGEPICALFQDVDDYYMVIPFMYDLKDDRQLEALKTRNEFIAFVCGGYGHSTHKDGFRFCTIDKNNKIHIEKDKTSQSLKLINALYTCGRDKMHFMLRVPENRRDEYLYDDLPELINQSLRNKKLKLFKGAITYP